MKLEGLRVLDLSSFLPGPYLTLALADHGAEVIKIEQPGEGDPARHIAPMDGDHSVLFRNVNRGKKSIALNLKDAADHAAFLRLADGADVIVESSRPGVAARLGIDYDTLAARNPRLIYCSLSAFGQDGPYARRPSHDLGAAALSGVLGMNLGADDRPVITALPISDLTAGLHGLAGVLMALYARERTGRGDYIDISMHETLVAASLNILATAQSERRQPVARHGRSTGGAAFYSIYDTSDGRQIVLAGQEPKFIRALLGELGRLDLAPLCERGPGPHQQPVFDLLRETFAAMTRAEAADLLERLDVCWAPVNTLVEGLDDPHLVARGGVFEDAQGRRHIAPPIRFRHDPAQPVLEPPALNQHAALAAKQS
jgi:crotonobetainyl-CoA:carnitine CoA-transferase CaiB-like acyl-CoA transferase